MQSIETTGIFPLQESLMLIDENKSQHESSSLRSVNRNNNDFRDLYSFSRARRRGSARSLSSFTTDWSTSTAPTSNTTKAKEEKRRQKRRFMDFTKVLMRLLEKKDPNRFGEAKAVIKECEQKKKRGEVGYESVTESLRRPLKQVVGSDYWKQARLHLFKNEIDLTGEVEIEPLSYSDEDPTPCLSPSEMGFLQHSLHLGQESFSSSLPATMSPCQNLLEEKKLRRDRFWKLIRVLMKYLELKNYDLYLTAKDAMQECVRRNKNREEGYASLTGSIQTSLKQVVGVKNWRRAESYLARLIVQEKAEEEALVDDWASRHQYPLSYYDGVPYVGPIPYDYVEYSPQAFTFDPDMYEAGINDTFQNPPASHVWNSSSTFFENGTSSSSSNKRTIEKVSKLSKTRFYTKMYKTSRARVAALPGAIATDSGTDAGMENTKRRRI